MYHSGVSATLPRPQFSTKGSAAISCCPEGRVHFGAPPRVSPPGFRALGPLRRVSSKVFTQRTPWYRTYRIVRFVSVRRYSFFSHLAPFLGLNETRATNILQANWSLPLCVITCHNHVHVVGIHVSGIAIFFHHRLLPLIVVPFQPEHPLWHLKLLLASLPSSQVATAPLDIRVSTSAMPRRMISRE